MTDATKYFEGLQLFLVRLAPEFDELERERVEEAADAIAALREVRDKMNCTAVIAHALQDGAISDQFAYVFEDALRDMNEALARIDSLGRTDRAALAQGEGE